MNRRDLISMIGKISTFGAFGFSFSRETISFSKESIDDLAPTNGYKTFAYYQGLSQNQQRSQDRNDGTYYKMPCISIEDVDIGIEKTYDFWHGHGTAIHRFTLTSENLLQLKNGQAIEVYTNLVDSHRHSLKVDTSLNCQILTMQNLID